jgi:predicted nucleic acid-binding protein
MNEVFCDTSYFVALLDPRDDLHDKAATREREFRGTSLCTTSAVCVETLNYFSRYQPLIRVAAGRLVMEIQQHPQFAIVYVSSALLQSGAQLYQTRKDSSYSGTDCISMCVMRDRDVKNVLTSDKHFAHEEFTVLL